MMNIFAILGGIFLSITSFFSVPKATTQTQTTVLAIEVTPTEIPLPTETPLPTLVPTPYPTKIPVTPTPNIDYQTKIDELNKKVEDLSNKVNATPTPRPKYLCEQGGGVAVFSNTPCPDPPPTKCERTQNGVTLPCN